MPLRGELNKTYRFPAFPQKNPVKWGLMADNHNSTPWLAGTVFAGRYEVGTLIARGGMAEVYHAVDLWSNNPVAVKVLLPHLSADQAQRQKFFREGNALSKIHHEHVVGVVQDGTQKVHGQDVMFLVLEYVHGCTLAQLLTLRPVLSVGEMLSIMLPAVEGLSEVHAHRLIHRDMKPANVLLEDTSRGVKLSDFGLTRRTDQSWTGELMGTPAYVAPEIMDPRATVGAPADIFAVGVMMYRMVTGRLPFPGQGNDQQVLYHNINSEIPPVTLVAPGISSDVAGVISWCTRRTVKDRPQDAAELFRALRDISGRMSQSERAYRAELAEFPRTGLWEDVTAIAEKSGMTRVYRSTPISGFGSADDLLHEGPAEPLTEHEQSVLAAAEEDGQVYEPTQISGVGPLTERQAAVEAEQTAGTVAGAGGATDETLFWDVAQDPDATTAVSAQLAREQAERESAEQAARDAAGYDAISAGYNPGRAPASPAPNQDTAPPVHPERPADTDRWSEAQRRVPQHPWRPTMNPVLLLLLTALLMAGFVLAGFVGWWLAGLLF